MREFVTDFDGMSGTAKQKAVLAETDASYMSLHSYFGVRKVKAKNIEKLLAAIKRHTKPVRPVALGIIGQPHLFARMEAAGGEPEDLQLHPHSRRSGRTSPCRRIRFRHSPRRSRRRQRTKAHRNQRRELVTGNPKSIPEIGPSRLKSLDSVLARVKANTEAHLSDDGLHVACPRVQYTDRGKSAIVVEGED